MESPLVLSREQVRRVDVLAVEHYGMSSLVLMENAGRGVAELLLKQDPSLKSPSAGPPRGPGRASVAILCGKGNNAGDGFVVARHLEILGVRAKTLLLFPPDELTGDPRANYEILVRSGAPLIDVSIGCTSTQLEEHAAGDAWLVDAMLGTGASGQPRAPVDEAIAWMNSQAAKRLAIDLPSGLDCDTGEAAATTVRADITCTLVAMKRGMLIEAARPYLGEVHVVSIGVPPRLVREVAGA